MNAGFREQERLLRMEPRVVGPGFHERVFAVVRRIPAGKVSTYGHIAALLGAPSVARHVGYALAAADHSVRPVPWHRVVNARGQISTHSPRQRQLLEAEVLSFHPRVRFLWLAMPGVRRRVAGRSAAGTPSAFSNRLRHQRRLSAARLAGIGLRNRRRVMLVSEIMSRPAVCCSQKETLNAAAQLMWEHDCGVILVTGDFGHLVGVVTDRDICMATYTQGKAPAEILISDVMAKQVFTCAPGDEVEVAEHLMREQQIRRIPVVDIGNHPVGMLSLNDIARNAATGRRPDGAVREVVQTVAAICRPRARSLQVTNDHAPGAYVAAS